MQPVSLHVMDYIQQQNYHYNPNYTLQPSSSPSAHKDPEFPSEEHSFQEEIVYIGQLGKGNFGTVNNSQ